MCDKTLRFFTQCLKSWGRDKEVATITVQHGAELFPDLDDKSLCLTDLTELSR